MTDMKKYRIEFSASDSSGMEKVEVAEVTMERYDPSVGVPDATYDILRSRGLKSVNKIVEITKESSFVMDGVVDSQRL